MNTEPKIEQRDPRDLHPHRLIKGMPQWSDEDPRLHSLADDIRDHGIREPIKITSKNEVVDGRHRLRGAKRYQLATVPVMVVPDDEAAEIAVGTLLHRRHFTSGQRAYLLAGIIEEAWAESKRRQIAALKAGGQIPVRNSVSNGSKTPEEYAAEIGVSVQYLRLAKELQELFKDDTRRTLTDDEGQTENDVTLRDFYEPRMLREEKPYGLGAVKRGVAYSLEVEKFPGKKTGGKPKRTEDQLRLFNQVVADELNRWEYWSKFDAEERAEHFKTVRTKASQMEPETLEELAEYHSKLSAEFRKAARQGKE